MLFNNKIIYLNNIYQLSLILTALRTLSDKRCLSHNMCLHQVMMMLHFLNVIIASLKRETICKLINRILGSRLYISS